MKPSIRTAGLVLALAAISRCASQNSPTAVRPPADSSSPTSDCRELKPPVLLVKSPPDYPANLRRQGIHGRVRLDGFVEADGSVGDVRVVESPSSELSLLALDAIRVQRYKPATCDGVPARVSFTFTTEFNLDN